MRRAPARAPAPGLRRLRAGARRRRGGRWRPRWEHHVLPRPGGRGGRSVGRAHVRAAERPAGAPGQRRRGRAHAAHARGGDPARAPRRRGLRASRLLPQVRVRPRLGGRDHGARRDDLRRPDGTRAGRRRARRCARRVPHGPCDPPRLGRRRGVRRHVPGKGIRDAHAGRRARRPRAGVRPRGAAWARGRRPGDRAAFQLRRGDRVGRHRRRRRRRAPRVHGRAGSPVGSAAGGVSR